MEEKSFLWNIFPCVMLGNFFVSFLAIMIVTFIILSIIVILFGQGVLFLRLRKKVLLLEQLKDLVIAIPDNS